MMLQVEAMLGKFSLDTMMNFGGKSAGLFLILYLFTMIVMIMNFFFLLYDAAAALTSAPCHRVVNFFLAILNDFLSAVASSKNTQNRDFEVMDHFIDTVTMSIYRDIDTVTQLVVTRNDSDGRPMYACPLR